MLNYQHQNFHHSKMPSPGTIGHIVGLSTVNPRRKCIVAAYPLTDSGEIRRLSGIWFVEAD